MFARKAKAWKVDRALIAAQALPANSNDDDINGRVQGTRARRDLVCRRRGSTTAGRPRIARALAMLRGKTVELPPRKHDNLPV